MVDNFKTYSNKNQALSPVIGVILMVAVVVALVALVAVTVFDTTNTTGEVDETVKSSSVKLSSNGESVEARTLGDTNVEKIKLVKGSQSKELSTNAGDSATLQAGSGSYKIVAVTSGGKETVVQSKTFDSTEVNVGTTLEGKVSVNPPISGATVIAKDSSGNTLATNITDSQGNYAFSKKGIDHVDVVVTDFTHPELSNPLSATKRKQATSGTVNIDFDETSGSTISIDDQSRNIIYGANSSGYKLVGNVYQLQFINNDLDADYKIINDIDASETSTWNKAEDFEETEYISSNTFELEYEVDTIDYVEDNDGNPISYNLKNDDKTIEFDNGDPSDFVTVKYNPRNNIYKGFNPIGDISSSEFKGRVIGENYKINNLFINRITGDHIGLIEATSTGSHIKSVGLDNADINGGSYLGLVGTNDGTINNTYVSGDINGNERVAGIAGSNSGTINNSYFDGTLINSGGDYTGGIVSNNNGVVLNSYTKGTVEGKSFTGGLIGYNQGGSTTSKSFSEADVTGTNSVGGLVGYSGPSFSSDTVINNTYSTGNVDGSDSVGGLVGENNGYSDTDSIMKKSYSTGTVSGGTNVGGAVGKNSGSISNVYWDETDTITESGSDISTTGTGNHLITSEMQGTSTSMTFTSNSIWNTITGDYPELSWES